MPQLRKRRPSPALVVSIVALLVALGGTSYAALKLPANSVGNRQLKKNAVTSSKVKDGSLQRRDFARGQVPAGSQGPQGPAGPSGRDGTNGTNGTNGKDGADGAVTAYHVAQSITPITVTAGDGMRHDIVSLALPAGKWVLSSKNMASGASGGTGEIDCFLVDTADTNLDTSIAELEDASGGNAFQDTMANLATVDLTSPDTVKLQCRNFGTINDMVFGAKLVATQVNTLNP